MRLDSCVGAWWWVIHDTIAVVKEVLDTVVCKVLPVTSNKWLQNTVNKACPAWRQEVIVQAKIQFNFCCLCY